jgi:photosystem II stability/assembly factor-like uncharacterized protein
MKRFFFLLTVIIISIQFSYAQDGVGTWTLNYNNGARIWAMVIDPVNQNNMYIGGIDSGIYKTTNSGTNWFPVNNGLTYIKVNCLAISKSNPSILYAGTDSLGGASSGIYKTTNGGNNWTMVMNGITAEKSIQWILIHPTNPNIAYCAIFNALAASTVGVYKTTDGGANWLPSSNGMANKNILCMAMNPLNPNVIYAGSSLIVASSSGPVSIYRTDDAGANWYTVINGIPQTSTDNNPVRCLSISTSDTSVVLAGLFMNAAALTGGMYVTTNSGQLWTQRNTGIPATSGTLVRSCIIKPGSSTEMYAGLDRATATDIGIKRSTDQGVTWTDFSGGLVQNTYSFRTLAFKIVAGMHTLYAGESSTALLIGRGLFEYSWLVSGINSNGEIPKSYSLSQNYPNPFNPVTKIAFQLAKPGNVKLAVYDFLGREVLTLVNDYKQAGSYDFDFNASSLSSGTYFYRIESNDFTATKKMTLIK